MAGHSVEAAWSAPFISPVTHVPDPTMPLPAASAEVTGIHNPSLTSCRRGQKEVGLYGAANSSQFFVVEIDVFKKNGRNQNLSVCTY